MTTADSLGSGRGGVALPLLVGLTPEELAEFELALSGMLRQLRA